VDARELRRAAAVVPIDRAGRVLVGKRTLAARSYPGYIAFPGGGLESGDERLPRALTNAPDPELRGCALRELGEETGRWPLVTRGLETPSREAAARFCESVARGAPIDDVLRACELVLDDRALVPLGLWVTSDHRPARFAVQQFLLRVDGDDAFVCATPNDELDGIHWCAPRDIRARFEIGDELLLPPIRHVVLALAAGLSHDETLRELLAVRPPDEPEAREIAFGIAVQPLRSPTLPPATTTNTILVGHGDFVVVDPATHDADERARFDALLDLLATRGRRARAILLTHHHIDHMSDVERLVASRRLPVWAHRLTAERIDVEVARTIEDDEVIVIDGARPKRLRALFTPGHAAGHLAFLDEETGVLIAGDMVASEGSILIDPSEGHMGTYLASLRRLLSVGARRVLPAHGPLLFDGMLRLEEHLAHRLHRQEQVHGALRREGSGATCEEIAQQVYAGAIPPAALPLAARSVESAVALLVEERRARRLGDRYLAA